MFDISYTLVIILISATALYSLKDFQSLQSCTAGDITENDCTKCICTPNFKNIFECYPKPCNGTFTKKKPSCQPNTIYNLNSTSCICTKQGYWPHENCENIFQSFPTTFKRTCEPNSYFIVDCNVCRCGADGIVDNGRCTQNNCNKTNTRTRRLIEQNHVYGSCEAQNWYSLASCQFCYCVSENKLVCNTGNSYSKNLQLGSYNLSICGKELISDALSLMPNKDALRIGDKLYNDEALTELQAKPTGNAVNDKAASVELNRERNEDSDQNYDDKNEEYYSEVEDNPNRVPNEIAVKFNPDWNYEGLDIAGTEASKSEEMAKTPNALNNEVSPSNYDEEVPIASDPELKGGASGKRPKFNLGKVLKPYLPVVLDKVFQMALRKSLVSVDASSNCTPGSTNVVECNTCFCLKNNKLLCTNNKCE